MNLYSYFSKLIIYIIKVHYICSIMRIFLSMFNRRDTFVLEAYSCIIGEDNVLNGTDLVNGTREIPFTRHLNMFNRRSYAFSKSYPKVIGWKMVSTNSGNQNNYDHSELFMYHQSRSTNESCA